MADTTAYSALLKDPRWQKKRLEIFERDDWACRFCHHNDKTLTIHHRRYSNDYAYPWDYPNYLLLTLCEECHNHITHTESNCLNCYEFMDGYCSCREPSDMVTDDCLDWFPRDI